MDMLFSLGLSVVFVVKINCGKTTDIYEHKRILCVYLFYLSDGNVMFKENDCSCWETKINCGKTTAIYEHKRILCVYLFYLSELINFSSINTSEEYSISSTDITIAIKFWLTTNIPHVLY